MWRNYRSDGHGTSLPAGEATCQPCRAEARATAAAATARTPRTVTCHCGVTFDTLDRRRRFCSPDCTGQRLAEVASKERREAIRTLGWDELADPDSWIVSDLTFAVQASLSTSIIAAAGRRSDGLTHIEIVDWRDGEDWVVERVDQLIQRWTPTRVLGHLGPSYPVTIACPTLHAAIAARTVRHLGCPVLTDGIASARVRYRDGGWHWDRKPGGAWTGPLLVAAVAHHALVA